MSMSVAAVAGPVASVQHGAIALRQLIEAGLSEKAVRRAVETGEILRVAAAVYVIAGSPNTWKQRRMIAVLDAGPGSCVSHRAAARLLGIARLGALEVVEITTPRTRTHRLDGVVVHRLLDLSDEHVMIVDGIPCTGYLRTLVDLGAVEPLWEVRDMLERCLIRRLVTVAGAEWAVTHHSRRGRNGVGVLRRVLDDRALFTAMPDSVLEARMARIFRQYGLPMAAFQHEIRDSAGSFVARVDFAYPELRRAFEVNGWEAHGTPWAAEADYDRVHCLDALGWTVTSFTYWHVVKRPAYVAKVIRQILGAHTALVGR
jgi:very-short-patch-repair endonuclease